MSTTRSSSEDLPLTAAAASRYQQLRGHLAALRLDTAAEQLPTVLDQATEEGLTLTAALERLLGLEVDATEARRLAGRLRFACLPTPASLEDFDYDTAAIGFVGVERRHGAGGAVDADVGGHRHVDAVDDDPYVRVIVLGRPHRSQVQSGGRDPGRRVIWCRPGGAEVSLRTGEVAERAAVWTGQAGQG
jgi:hypothetical protein